MKITSMERNVVSSALTKQVLSVDPSAQLRALALGLPEHLSATRSEKSVVFSERAFIFDPPVPLPPVIARFEKDEFYEGAVVAVHEEDGLFTARIVNMIGGPDEEAEFSMREIPEDDRHLVMPGAEFSWAVGLQWRKRTATRVSEIRFRRRPRFTAKQLVDAEREGVALASLFQDLDAQSNHASFD